MVRSLLADQHPDLAALPLVELAAGWDNNLWRLGDDLLVRLPRRAMAAPLTSNEHRWLPVLAPMLPLPVAVPLRMGEPSDEFPWPWSIVPWMDGEAGDRVGLSRPEESAERLGRFLRALHQTAPIDAPWNPYRSVPLAERAQAFEARLVQVGDRVHASGVRPIWDRALEAGPWTGARVWLHGDLHPANTVVADGVLSGVIDFGDICAGDPATDLAGAWMLLPPDALPAFETAYGGVDPDLGARTLGWLVLFALTLIGIAEEDRRPTYATVGQAALAKVLA